MSAWVDRVLAPWDALDHDTRRHWTVILLSGVLFLVHFAWFSHWFIEDAAITFSYARYFAQGEGFAPYAGGEWVEGFSNPTWTLLLAALDFVGINPWIGSKLAGAVLGLVGLPFAWRWARHVLGERSDLAAAFVPLLLALSPQYVNWAASGLENSVITVLMAAGGALMLDEVEERRALPWSGLLWGLLSISRPEAPAYAAIAGLVGIFGVGVRRGPLAALDYTWRWGALSALPFFAWHAWAFATFAWEAPNTYFAKLHDGGRFAPWAWAGNKARSWGYLRRYALWYGHGFLLWLYLFGQSGFKGWRARGVAVFSVFLYLVILPGTVWLWDVWGEAPLEGTVPLLDTTGAFPLWPFSKDPTWLSTFRILLLGAITVVAPVLGWHRKGAIGRTLAWWVTGFVMYFALYAGGDWMDGVRWMNLCSVPLTILLVDALFHGLDALEERLARIPARLLVAVPLATVAVLMVIQSVILITRPETSPYNVRRRVLYGQLLMDRLDVRRPTFMDVDMGAHQWFAGPRSEIVDIAGLIDVPMGHHKWQKPFVSEYVFRERRPHIAHVHGGWAGKSGLRSHPRFRSDYLPVTDFPVSPSKLHIGNHVRRDLVFPPDKVRNPERAVTFQTGFALADWELPHATVNPGGTFTVRVWWERLRGIPRGVRPVVFLAHNGKVEVVKELPPAYDWLQVSRWKQDEIARGVHRLTLPDDLPEGTYDLGFAILSDRANLQALDRPASAVKGAPVFIRGEVRWADVVTVVGPDAHHDTVMADVRALLDSQAPCDDREARWLDDLVYAYPPDDAAWWRTTREVEVALAICRARELDNALQSGATPERLASLGARARWWDHRPWEVQQATEAAGAHLRALSVKAEERGDVEAAYALSRDSLILAPHHAWERRRAESLRDERLGIHKTPSLSRRILEKLGLEEPAEEEGPAEDDEAEDEGLDDER